MTHNPNAREVESAKETSLPGVCPKCGAACECATIANSRYQCGSVLWIGETMDAAHQSDRCKLTVAARLEGERDELKLRLLSAAGDDLCRLTQEEIKAYSSGAVKIPPREEFIPSCERFHAQIAGEAGVLENCLTLAQLIAENQKLQTDLADMTTAAHLVTQERDTALAKVTDPLNFFNNEEETLKMKQRAEAAESQLSAAQAERDEAVKENARLREVWFPADQTIGCHFCGWIDWEDATGEIPKHSDECPIGYMTNNYDKQIAAAQAAADGLVGDFTEAVSLLSVMAIEGAQFLRRLSCYERVENTERFYQAICESEKFTAKAIAMAESAAHANYPATKEPLTLPDSEVKNG